MRTCLTGIAAAALLLAAASLPARAEDAAAPAATTATPPAPSTATPGDAKPAFAPRPAPVPNATEAAPEATAAPPPRRHRHYARHSYRRYAYWEPFPVYLPHLYHHRIVWNRVRWFW